MQVTPKGYKFRNLVFRSVEELAIYYKKHYKDGTQSRPASTQPSTSSRNNGAAAGPRRSRWGDEPATQRAPQPPAPAARATRWG